MHARAFHDFDGAGRFIRFVYLVGNNDSAVIKYINEYLTAKKLSLILPSAKFHRIELGGFALRVERHTEFLTISFVEKGLKVKSGISDDAFDQSRLLHLPFEWAQNAPAPLFNAISVEVGQQLAAGEALGLVGTSGNITRPQLHFEVRRDGKPIDPLKVLGF